MSAYFHEFTPIEPATNESRQAYREAFLVENEETEELSDLWGEFNIPEDFIDFAERHGLNQLVWERGERTFTFCDSEYMHNELDSLKEEFPTAFPIARDDYGDYYLYTSWREGMGLYNVGASRIAVSARYIAPSFTAFFIEGQGIDILLSG